MTHETYLYGKFVTRMKGDDKLGTCTSFFTFWSGTESEPWAYSDWSEIDAVLTPSDEDGTFNTNGPWPLHTELATKACLYPTQDSLLTSASGRRVT